MQYIEAKTSQTSSVEIPAHKKGDLIIIFASRDGSTTPPTVPSGLGFSSGNANTGTTCSVISASKVATSDKEVSGQWANATEMIAVVIRGGASIIRHTGANGTGTTVNYSGIVTMSDPGVSWGLRFAFHKSTNTNLQNPPTGFTNIANAVGANEIAAHSTLAPAASVSFGSVSVGGTSSDWITQTIEVLTQGNTPPTVALDAPADAAVITDDTPTLEFTGSDTQSNDIAYQVQVFDAEPTGNAAEDDFDRANGAMGSNWTTAGDGGLTILNNKAYGNANFEDRYSVWDGTFSPSGADYSVEADVVMVGTGEFADADIIVRFQDVNNYYAMRLWTYGQEIILYKVVGGTKTDLDTYPLFLAHGVRRHMRLEAIGTSIKGYLDGVEVVSATDSSITSAGLPALYATGHSAAGITFDNFRAYEAQPVPILEKFSAHTDTIVVQTTSDAEEYSSDGYVETQSSDIEMLHDGEEMTVGLWFPKLFIPQGATIDSAYIDFTVDVSRSGGVNIDIHADDQDNAPGWFEENAYTISGRSKTTAGVTWSAGGDGSAENTIVTTSDIKTLFQEVVDRPAWRAENNAALIFDNPSTTNFREFETIEGEPGDAPYLRLVYTVSDAGFANQDDGGDTSPFTAGDQIGFTVQAGDALDPGTYYWRVRAKDPSGSNQWGAWSSLRSFEVSSATPADSERAAELIGKDTTNSERAAELTGQAAESEVNDERDAELHGEDTETSERDAELQGKDTASSERPVEVTGVDEATSEREVEINTQDNASSEREVEIVGFDTANAEREAEATGIEGANSERVVELHGEDTTIDERDAETTGIEGANAERDAETIGTDSQADERSAEIRGMDTADSEREAEIAGTAQANAEREVELLGEDQAISERDVEVLGQATATTERDAEVAGTDTANSERDVEMLGEGGVFSQRNVELTGKDTAADEREAEVHGANSTADERVSELLGQDTEESERQAEVIGQALADSERDAETGGIDTTSDTRDIEITGKDTAESERGAELTGVVIEYTRPTIIRSNKRVTPITSRGEITVIGDDNTPPTVI